jgi:O-antigen/teichoic acid export membrane protein
MGFFGPISSPLLDESSTPMVRRALHRARVVGNFALVQAGVQIIGFVSGILLVRKLSQSEYAFFTIANTMQGTINLLADIGISVGLISIGGRVWQDRYRFGELINTALAMRRRFGLLALVLITPIMYFMLVRNGASASYTWFLILAVLAGLLFQLSLGVLSVIPRLRSNLKKIQTIDLTGAVVRLLLICAFLSFFINAGIAVLIASTAMLLQYLLLRSYAAAEIDLEAPENAADKQEILRLSKHLAANAIFYCVQGQITIFLIGFFAHQARSVAEVGALGRLAMIFTVISNLLTNVFVPAFARCEGVNRLRLLFFAIVGSVSLFSVVIVAGAVWFPDQFLFVLGSKYGHLQSALVLMVLAAVINAIAGTLWALNSSKAWIAGSWLYIPLTLGTQLVLIPFTNFSRVDGVLLFNVLSLLPSLLLNVILSLRGFHRYAAAAR